MALRSYLATEVALDHADGLLTRREALQRLGLLGLSVVAASGLPSACAAAPAAPAAPSPARAADHPLRRRRGHSPYRGDHLPGGTGSMFGAFAAAQSPGAVLVVHENRGLTDRIRAVTGGSPATATPRSPGSALPRGRHRGRCRRHRRARRDQRGRPRRRPAQRPRRAGPPRSGATLGAVGFCFGGGMVWQLLTRRTELAAAAPFYGPLPDDAAFTGAKAAVLGIFAEQDDRVNAGRDTLDRALTAAGVTHEFVTEPARARVLQRPGQRSTRPPPDAYRRLLAWFGAHLG